MIQGRVSRAGNLVVLFGALLSCTTPTTRMRIASEDKFENTEGRKDISRQPETVTGKPPNPKARGFQDPNQP